jgi:hypothetical protein
MIVAHIFLNVLSLVVGCMWHFIVIIWCIMTDKVGHLNQAFCLTFNSWQCKISLISTASRPALGLT